MTAEDAPAARIAALRAEIDEVEEELAAADHPRTRARLEAALAHLRAELATLEAGVAPEMEGIHIDQSGHSGGNTAGAANTYGDQTQIGDTVHGPKVAGGVKSDEGVNIAGRDQIINNFYGGDADAVAPLLRAYLNELAGVCDRLALADADSDDPNKAALKLHAVYVGLEVRREVALPPEDPQQVRERAISLIKRWGYASPEEYAAAYDVSLETAINHAIRQLNPREQHRRLRAVEVLAAHPRLVITGTPGSGKSSFVNFVSICLAQAGISGEDWLKHLGADWPHGRLIPIRVVLREFAAWLAGRSQPATADPGLFWEWLEHGAGRPRLLVQHLRTAFADGQAILMLDGLDEVPSDATGQPLRHLRAIITTLASGQGRCVLTCRVLDYQRPERQLADWPVEEIAPLALSLRDQLIAQWFAALDEMKRTMRGDADTLRAGLQRAIRVRPELQRLAGNPLLLTMMARLQAHDGDLPGERVKLYERSLTLLLLQWRRDALGCTALGEQLKLSQWSDSHMDRLLDRLGYVAHTRGVSGDAEQGADLPRGLLRDTAEAFFEAYGSEQSGIRALTFLNYISAHGNGVLQQHDQKIYRFPHRTFQEYLAGRRLLSDEGWEHADEQEFVDRVLKVSAQGPQWREAVLLAISDYAIRGQTRPALNVSAELLRRAEREGNGRDPILAAEVLLEVGRERIIARSPELWQHIQRAITVLLQGRNPDGRATHPVAERVRAGFLLGQLGDERMPVSLAAWQAQCTQRSGEGYFCPIPAGNYQIGSSSNDPDAQEHEQPQHTAKLKPYWIARFPITNAQWKEWVDAGGSPARYADDDDVNQPNQPVVGITWHEANAFCDWLTAQLADVLPAGYVLRLPREAEWEAAARGPQGWRYPWGDAWQPDCAAMQDDRDARGAYWTVPVGCYPSGAAACGAMDLAGNVWEWTLDRWHSYPNAKKTFTQEKFVVVRGGGYDTNRTYARCGARGRNLPGSWSHLNGFRVVVAPPLAHTS